MLIDTVVVGNLYTNCYFLDLGGSLLIIDPGGEPDLLAEKIRRIDHEDLHLIATHCHFDHILAARSLQDEFNCELLMHRNEKDFLQPSAVLSEQLFGTSPDMPECTFIDGSPLFDGMIQVIETPGHTPGSISLVSGDMMFTGDTLFRDSIGRTDFFGSEESMMKSLKAMYQMDRNYRLFTGHGESTTLDREKQNNMIFRLFAGVD